MAGPRADEQPVAAGGVDRSKMVLVKDRATGRIVGRSVKQAVEDASDGRADVATAGDLDSKVTAERILGEDRDKEGAMDWVKAYALNAWDEFTFGAAPGLYKSWAAAQGGDAAAAQVEDEFRRLRQQNPTAYHAGGLAGGIGSIIATEGIASTLRAQKLAEAARLTDAAAAAKAAGETAKAEVLSSRAAELTKLAEATGVAQADAAHAKQAALAAERAGEFERVSTLSREMEVTRALKAERAARMEAEAAGEAAGRAAAEASIKESAPFVQGGYSRIAEAIDAGAPVAKAGLTDGIERSVAYGAAEGLHGQITQATMGDKPFSFEDAVASTFAGAAIGGGSHIGATLAAKGISSSAAAFASRESDRAIAQALKGYGVTGKEMKKIATRFGSAGDELGLRGIQQEMLKGGVDLAETDATQLFKKLDEATKQVGRARNEIMTAAQRSGAGSLVEPERIRAQGMQLLAESNFSTEEGARVGRSVLKNFNKTMDRLETTDVSRRLAQLDSIQSEMGKLAEKALDQNMRPTMRTNIYRDLKSIVRNEMDRTMQATGNPQLYNQFRSVNKTYSALRVFDRMANRGLKTANARAAGEASSRTGVARVLGRAAMSTALFGAPYSVLYDAAGGSLFHALGAGADRIRKGMAGIAVSVSATAQARTAFSSALSNATSRASGKAVSFALSKNVSKYTSKTEFDKLIARLREGAISATVIKEMAKVDPSYEGAGTAWNSKLRSKVEAMLPKVSPYPVGYAKFSAKPSNGTLVSPDEMKVLRYLDGVANPLSVPSKIVFGAAGPEHIQAVSDMYPGIFASMREGLVEDLMRGSLDATLSADPQARSAVSSFLGMPVSASNSPDFAAQIAEQRAAAQQEQEQAKQKAPSPPSGGGGSNQANYMTESERISK